VRLIPSGFGPTRHVAFCYLPAALRHFRRSIPLHPAGRFAGRPFGQPEFPHKLCLNLGTGPSIPAFSSSIHRRPTIRPADCAVAALRCSHTGVCSAPVLAPAKARRSRGGRWQGGQVQVPEGPSSSGRLIGRLSEADSARGHVLLLPPKQVVFGAIRRKPCTACLIDEATWWRRAFTAWQQAKALRFRRAALAFWTISS
jgi:hypothetical protein